MPANKYPIVLRSYSRKGRHSKDRILCEVREYDKYDTRGQYQLWVWKGNEFAYVRDITSQVLEERRKNSLPILAWSDDMPFIPEEASIHPNDTLSCLLHQLKRISD
jgi:hypothetical protein